MAWYGDFRAYQNLMYGSIAGAAKRASKLTTKPIKGGTTSKNPQKPNGPFAEVRPQIEPPKRLGEDKAYTPPLNKKSHKNIKKS